MSSYIQENTSDIAVIYKIETSRKHSSNIECYNYVSDNNRREVLNSVSVQWILLIPVNPSINIVCAVNK
jgi:hypothetical protein